MSHKKGTAGQGSPTMKAPVKKGRPPGSTNANKKRQKEAARAGKTEVPSGRALKQAKIGDFLGGNKVAVSFDGRMESFSEDQVLTLMALLRCKKAFSKEQLALAVELWNTNPDPECFVFRHGDRSDMGLPINLATFDAANAEHILFRPVKKQ